MRYRPPPLDSEEASQAAVQVKRIVLQIRTPSNPVPVFDRKAGVFKLKQARHVNSVFNAGKLFIRSGCLPAGRLAADQAPISRGHRGRLVQGAEKC